MNPQLSSGLQVRRCKIVGDIWQFRCVLNNNNNNNQRCDHFIMYHHLVLEHTYHSYSLAKATFDTQNCGDCSAQGLNSGRNFEKNMWRKHFLPLKTKMRGFLGKAKRSAVPKNPVKAPVVMIFKWVRWSFQICDGNYFKLAKCGKMIFSKQKKPTRSDCPTLLPHVHGKTFFGRVYVYYETLS